MNGIERLEEVVDEICGSGTVTYQNGKILRTTVSTLIEVAKAAEEWYEGINVSNTTKQQEWRDNVGKALDTLKGVHND